MFCFIIEYFKSCENEFNAWEPSLYYCMQWYAFNASIINVTKNAFKIASVTKTDWTNKQTCSKNVAKIEQENICKERKTKKQKQTRKHTCN